MDHIASGRNTHDQIQSLCIDELRSGLKQVNSEQERRKRCASPAKDVGPGNRDGVLVVNEDVKGEMEHGKSHGCEEGVRNDCSGRDNIAGFAVRLLGESAVGFDARGDYGACGILRAGWCERLPLLELSLALSGNLIQRLRLRCSGRHGVFARH